MAATFEDSAVAEQDEGAVLSRAGVARGLRQIAPLVPFVISLGVTFGVAAHQAGMPGSWAALMSALVFAGGSQFVALDLWKAPMPLVSLWLATLAVNARHLLLGAALYPWFSRLSLWRRYAVVAVLSDANWAAAMQAHRRGERDAGVLAGSGLLMWAAWVLGTAGGLWLGVAMADPKRFGLDVLLIVFFAAVLVDSWRGRGDVLPSAAAASGSLLAVWALPPQWHVVAGALTGALVGAVRHGRR